MSKLPNELLGQWNDQIEIDKMIDFQYTKFFNRNARLQSSWRYFNLVIPEMLHSIPDGSKNYLDMSGGNGASCEIMKYYGYRVMSCDFYQGSEYYKSYEPFLDSQKIPHVIHDCTKFPYPFEDDSYNILTSLIAIDCYGFQNIHLVFLKDFASILGFAFSNNISKETPFFFHHSH
jgi:hypothetical protein